VTTIKDVAEAAGVSIATVSRALHGLPRVSESTRQRVLAAAAELRYVASPSAASLASGQTNAIGVVAPFVNRWYFAAIVHSAEERLRKAGYDLLLYSLGAEAQERHRAFSGTLLRKRVDAVLVLGLQPTAEEVAALAAVGGPVAVVGVDVPGWAMAMGAVQATRRAGLRVPQDVSVIGIDDHEMAVLLDLTTVAQPVVAQGVLAAEMILTALTNPEQPLSAVTLPTELIVRGTTGPARH
jgi:LacI family transcriptional regulator, repressor for deo operon, udp, cdd, tsx, nupC, and nupG